MIPLLHSPPFINRDFNKRSKCQCREEEHGQDDRQEQYHVNLEAFRRWCVIVEPRVAQAHGPSKTTLATTAPALEARTLRWVSALAVCFAISAPTPDREQRDFLPVFLIDEISHIANDKLCGGPTLRGAPDEMLWVVLRLVDPNVIYFKRGRKVFTEPVGQTTRAFWISTFVAFAAASLGAWLREAPGRGHGSVHKEVHRLAGYFCLSQLEIFTPYAVNEFTVQVPLNVASRSIVVGRFPLHAIFVIVFEVIFRYLCVCG